MAPIEFYERSTIIKRIETVLNQINQRYFEGNYGILSVIDNGDYVTVCSRTGDRHFGVQSIFDALNNFSLDGFDDQDYYDIWDYLDFCKYILPENQETENELKTDNELSFSEKRQVALVDMLLGEAVPAPVHESSTLSELVEELKESVTQLNIRIYKLEQENKQLKSNQTEVKPKPKPEKTLAVNKAKKSKFTLPENFADYQQECDDLISALSCFYSVKKGKWGKDILQFILTPTDTQKESQLYPYPDKWKAGLYLHCGNWLMEKVNLSDPDDWEDWFMDINDFADANGIEIS